MWTMNVFIWILLNMKEFDRTINVNTWNYRLHGTRSAMKSSECHREMFSHLFYQEKVILKIISFDCLNYLKGFGCALNSVAFLISLRFFSSSRFRCSSFSWRRRSFSVLKFSSNCFRSFDRVSLCRLNGTGWTWTFSRCGTNGFFLSTSGSGFETNGFGRKLASYSSFCEWEYEFRS